MSIHTLRGRLDRLEAYAWRSRHLDDLDLAESERARDRLLEKLEAIRSRLGIMPVELSPEQGAACVAAFRALIRAMLDKAMGQAQHSDDDLYKLRSKVEAYYALAAPTVVGTAPL